jgi:hypothetical protein
LPEESVLIDDSRPLATFSALTTASATTAPLWSTTLPPIEALDCAETIAAPVVIETISKQLNQPIMFLIAFSAGFRFQQIAENSLLVIRTEGGTQTVT